MSYSTRFKNYINTNSFKNLSINNFFNNISSNKLFLGLMMIFMNLGSRYIEIKLTKGQEMLIKNIAREVLIFTIGHLNFPHIE